MPSVEVVWKGRCVDRQVQQALCEHLLELSELSNRKFTAYFGEKVDPCFYDKPEESKQYLIVSQVFWNEPLPKRIKQVDEGLYLVEGITLSGIEFTLFDPRSCTEPFALRRNKRMSFVFVQSEEPKLNGRIVQVRLVNKQHRLSGFAPMVLVNPCVDLRYYLEGWMGKFLGWVKHFYIPDLHYWIWDDYPGYETYRGNVSKDRVTAEQHFNRLMEAFSEEADSFTEQFESYRREREAQGEDGEIKPEEGTR
jgi:hypothetical protein